LRLIALGKVNAPQLVLGVEVMPGEQAPSAIVERLEISHCDKRAAFIGKAKGGKQKSAREEK
jgi:hypothetical protein